jgi:hypothetical protein
MNGKFVAMNDSVHGKLVEVTNGVQDKLAKLSESVNNKIGNTVTENRHFKVGNIVTENRQLTKDMEVNVKELVAHELTTFREQVCNGNQANIRANLADVSRSSTDKLNELTSRVNRLQERLSSNSCFQAVRDASEPQAVGEASTSSCPAARASVVATGVNGLE